MCKLIKLKKKAIRLHINELVQILQISSFQLPVTSKSKPKKFQNINIRHLTSTNR